MTATTTTVEEKGLTFEACATIGDLLAAQPASANVTEKVRTDVLKDAGVEPDTKVTDEQRRRAEVVHETKAGLRGKALATYIVTGEDAAAQVKKAEQTRKGAKGAGSASKGRSKGATREAKPAGTRGPREGSMLHSALSILGQTGKPMHPKELTAEMKRRKLLKDSKGKTPDASVNAALCTALKRSYPGLSRPERGKFQYKAGK